MNRIICHYDMDSYYASIELRENPSLKGKPFAVGGGIITTANYEARKFGVKSAMPVFQAKKLCPNLIILPVRKDLYFEIAELIHSLILKITDRVEFIASDEGYIDLTGIIKDSLDSKMKFALKFQERIKAITGLTCSVGIGYNKLSAKLASEVNKPQGVHIFSSEDDFSKYISDKPISIIPGVGKKLTQELMESSINLVSDVTKFSYLELHRKFGKSRGDMLYYYSKGVDDSPVEAYRKSHSIGNENTYRDPLNVEEQFTHELELTFQKVFERLMEENFYCKTISLKIRYWDFRTITRSYSFSTFTNTYRELHEAIYFLMSEVEELENIRLLGVSVSNLSKKFSTQLKLINR